MSSEVHENARNTAKKALAVYRTLPKPAMFLAVQGFEMLWKASTKQERRFLLRGTYAQTKIFAKRLLQGKNYGFSMFDALLMCFIADALDAMNNPELTLVNVAEPYRARPIDAEQLQRPISCLGDMFNVGNRSAEERLETLCQLAKVRRIAHDKCFLPRPNDPNEVLPEFWKKTEARTIESAIATVFSVPQFSHEIAILVADSTIEQLKALPDIFLRTVDYFRPVQMYLDPAAKIKWQLILWLKQSQGETDRWSDIQRGLTQLLLTSQEGLDILPEVIKALRSRVGDRGENLLRQAASIPKACDLMIRDLVNEIATSESIYELGYAAEQLQVLVRHGATWFESNRFECDSLLTKREGLEEVCPKFDCLLAHVAKRVEQDDSNKIVAVLMADVVKNPTDTETSEVIVRILADLSWSALSDAFEVVDEASKSEALEKHQLNLLKLMETAKRPVSEIAALLVPAPSQA